MFRNKKPLIPSILNEIEEFRDFFDIDFPSISRLDNSGISIYEGNLPRGKPRGF
jgi:hypothetical protein